MENYKRPLLYFKDIDRYNEVKEQNEINEENSVIFIEDKTQIRTHDHVFYCSSQDIDSRLSSIEDILTTLGYLDENPANDLTARMTALEGRISNIETWKNGDFATWKGTVDTFMSEMSTWKAGVNTSITNIQGDINTINQNFTTINNNFEAIEANYLKIADLWYSDYTEVTPQAEPEVQP